MRWVWVTIASAIWLVSSTAMAGPYEDAIEKWDNLDFAGAQAGFETALRNGDNKPPQVVELYKRLGMVHAIFGRTDQAEKYFMRMLSLKPTASLPDGLAPKITKPYTAAKGKIRGRLKIRAAIADDELAVETVSDPMNLVSGINVSGGLAHDAKGESQLVLSTAGVSEKILVTAYDEYGNTLWLSSLTPPAPKQALEKDQGLPSGTGADGRDSVSWYGQWYLWGGVAVGFAATGTVFALGSRSDSKQLDEVIANSSDFTFEDAQRLEDSANRKAWIARVSFGAAAAFAITSGVLFFTNRGDKESSNMALVPTLGRDQVGGSFMMRF